VLSGDASVADPVLEFAVDLGISTVIGVIAGVGLAAVISSRRAGVWRESSALAVLTVVTISCPASRCSARCCSWRARWW
jgi:hypothetical protein